MYGNIREHAVNMLVNFAFKSFPGRALAERRASILASPLHALEESLCSPPGGAGAPMGVLRDLSRGAGGKRRVRGREGRPVGRGRHLHWGRGGAGCPASRALLPLPPLLCNRALGSIKNSALQADCNAPSLGSTVWSGIKRKTECGFSAAAPAEAEEQPWSGAARAPTPTPCSPRGWQPCRAGLPTAAAVPSRPRGQARGSRSASRPRASLCRRPRCGNPASRAALPPGSCSAGRLRPETKAKARHIRGERNSASGRGGCLAVFVFIYFHPCPPPPPSLFERGHFGSSGQQEVRSGPSPARQRCCSQRRWPSAVGAPVPSLPPCRCLLFPQDRAKVPLGWAEAVRAAPHAWHLCSALSWLLSNQGPAAAALTKAEARVPLSSPCFDPPPRFPSVSCRRPGAVRRNRFTLGLASS